jgi:tetratricopeptide (TPR) repeat protein
MGNQMSWVKSMGCAAFIAAFSTMAIWATQADKTQNLESILTAASEAQAKGDFSAAAEYYRQAVKVSPNTAELWANLGLMDDLAGHSSEAIKSFSEAARLNASMFVPQLFLGIEYLKSNRAETAIPFLQRAEQINPKDPQAPLALGRAFALSGKGDRSSDAYWRAINLAPNDGNAWLGLGMAELQQSSADDRMMTEIYKDSVYATLRAGEIFAEQGKLIRASDAYKSALMAKSPLPPCAHAGYGIVLLRQKEVSRASSEFAQELKLNPGCGLARLGLAAISMIQGDTDRAQKEVVTLSHSDRGFLQESLPLLRDVLSEDQYGQLVHMAEDLEAHGDIPPAESADGLHTSSQAVPRELKEAETFYLSGQYQKCSDSLRPRLSVLTEQSLSLLTPCAFYTGDYRTASLAARKLKSIAATRVSGLYWESKADQKLAVTALTRAGETAQNSAQLHLLLGDIYRQKQRWEDAENEYRKALALEPHNQSASLGLAMALFGGGQSDEALAIDKALLMETQDNPEENLLAGEILVRSGHFTDAETYLKKIRDTGQKFMPRVHTLLGEVYFATDRYPQALSEFKLSQFSDDDGSIHYQLGRIYQKLGDKEKADEAFRVSKRLREQSDDRVNLTPQ